MGAGEGSPLGVVVSLCRVLTWPFLDGVTSLISVAPCHDSLTEVLGHLLKALPPQAVAFEG